MRLLPTSMHGKALASCVRIRRITPSPHSTRRDSQEGEKRFGTPMYESLRLLSDGCGAGGGTRTPTPQGTWDFKSHASACSATPAKLPVRYNRQSYPFGTTGKVSRSVQPAKSSVLCDRQSSLLCAADRTARSLRPAEQPVPPTGKVAGSV